MELKLKTKLLDIWTGGPLVVLLDDDVAKRLDVFVGDRVKLKINSKEKICVVDLAKNAPPNMIGIFYETAKAMGLKNNQVVTVSQTKKPKSVKFIREKLEGVRLTYARMKSIVDDLVNNVLTAVEIAYFVSSAKTVKFNLEETYNFTKAMVTSGNRLKWKKIAVSKHCIGGVSGNRTSMLIVPIIASAGLIMPKTSSRAITSPAGTADTMEVLAPVVVTNISTLRKIISKSKGCIVWGGALDLVPADDKIIKVEHPLGIDPAPMLLSSILAKKKSEGASKVLIDIPRGKYSKIKGSKKVSLLRKQFIRLGRKLGMDVRVIISSAEGPIGNGIGPRLEARDVMWALKGDSRAPKDLINKSIDLAGILFKMSGKTHTVRGGKKLAREILESGKAYAQMQKIIKAQGGDPKIDPNNLTLGKTTHVFKATQTGRIAEVNDDLVAEVAKLAGAPKEKKAGLYLRKHKGDKVVKGEELFTIYSSSKHRLQQATAIAGKMIRIK